MADEAVAGAPTSLSPHDHEQDPSQQSAPPNNKQSAPPNNKTPDPDWKTDLEGITIDWGDIDPEQIEDLKTNNTARQPLAALWQQPAKKKVRKYDPITKNYAAVDSYTIKLNLLKTDKTARLASTSSSPAGPQQPQRDLNSHSRSSATFKQKTLNVNLNGNETRTAPLTFTSSSSPGPQKPQRDLSSHSRSSATLKLKTLNVNLKGNETRTTTAERLFLFTMISMVVTLQERASEWTPEGSTAFG
jgi:hypothetical protein